MFSPFLLLDFMRAQERQQDTISLFSSILFLIFPIFSSVLVLTWNDYFSSLLSLCSLLALHHPPPERSVKATQILIGSTHTHMDMPCPQHFPFHFFPPFKREKKFEFDNNHLPEIGQKCTCKSPHHEISKKQNRKIVKTKNPNIKSKTKNKNYFLH